MPKKVFWPLALVVMGLIILAQNLDMLPSQLWNLWPLILVIVGLVGLVTSDRDDWMVEQPKKSSAKSKTAKKKKK